MGRTWRGTDRKKKDSWKKNRQNRQKKYGGYNEESKREEKDRKYQNDRRDD
mgnify:FL=1